VVGVTTNAAFTRALLARDDVHAGELDTGLLERVLGELATPPPDDLVAAGVLAAAGTAHPSGPWRRRLAGHGEARVADGRVTVGEREWSASVRTDADGAARIALDGVERRYAVAVGDEAIWVARNGHHLELRTERAARRAIAVPGTLEAPMPGTVLLVNVADGDAVAAGDVVLVLESMKMELAIAAPYAGTVAGLELRPGAVVKRGQPLVTVVAQEEERA
jgi:acetyl-CoA/propionyl-CoA carboxylase biotin carboxyl carrier protein